ncbi:MAG: hypothetical protein HOW73_19990 [Polyangiaceae bacterium]|nr:hypothetical protein [Polyangiaceae bacterium]
MAFAATGHHLGATRSDRIRANILAGIGIMFIAVGGVLMIQQGVRAFLVTAFGIMVLMLGVAFKKRADEQSHL